MSTMNETEIYDAIVAIMNENGQIKLRTFQTMDSSGLVVKIKALIAQQVREARIDEAKRSQLLVCKYSEVDDNIELLRANRDLLDRVGELRGEK